MPGVRVFQDTLGVLHALRAEGLQIGLLTNSDLPMWMRDGELRDLGLLDSIDVRLTAGDVGRLKPHFAPFRAVLDGLGVTPDEAVFVGDRLQDDVAGAQATGMRAVWVRRASSMWVTQSDSFGGPRPNATIDRLAQLLTTLDRWFPGWRKTNETQSNSV
jgi:FMN phosphatase YigB (HAD superfamily)